MDFLACTHHSYMIGALGHKLEQEKIRVLLVGLGGGSLSMFLAEKFPQVTEKGKSSFL